MTLSAWNAYKAHAWGDDTLRPLSLRRPSSKGEEGAGSGETIIGSLSTLMVMNLSEPVREGLQWAVNGSTFNMSALNTEPSLFERNVAGMWGGLLSAYALLSTTTTTTTTSPNNNNNNYSTALPEDQTMATAIFQKAAEYGAKLMRLYKETGEWTFETFTWTAVKYHLAVFVTFLSLSLSLSLSHRTTRHFSARKGRWAVPGARLLLGADRRWVLPAGGGPHSRANTDSAKEPRGRPVRDLHRH